MKTPHTFFLAIFCLALLPAPALAAPQIFISDPAFQFGTIAEGDRLEHVFTFANRGDQTLSIERVRSTCGCTGTLLSSREILPGKSGEVRITFNSNGMRGPITKWVYIYSNDPATPKAALRIAGLVKPEIDIQPDRLQLTNMRPGEKRQADITLTNNGERTIFLSNLATMPASLSASLSQTRLAPGASARIRATLALPAEKSRQNGYITLSTSSPRSPKLRISVFGVGRERTP